LSVNTFVSCRGKGKESHKSSTYNHTVNLENRPDLYAVDLSG
jgi:hypothetical protein